MDRPRRDRTDHAEACTEDSHTLGSSTAGSHHNPACSDPSQQADAIAPRHRLVILQDPGVLGKSAKEYDPCLDSILAHEHTTPVHSGPDGAVLN